MGLGFRALGVLPFVFARLWFRVLSTLSQPDFRFSHARTGKARSQGEGNASTCMEAAWADARSYYRGLNISNWVSGFHIITTILVQYTTKPYSSYQGPYINPRHCTKPFNQRPPRRHSARCKSEALPHIIHTSVTTRWRSICLIQKQKP